LQFILQALIFGIGILIRYERMIRMADKKQNAVKYGEVVSKCWEDEAYKKRFIEDPEGVLSEAGFVVDEGVTYKVIEAPKLVKYLVLPHTATKEAVQTIAKNFLNKVEKNAIVIPEGAEVRIIQNTDDMRYMVLPASPKTLTQAELKMVAGGGDVEADVEVVNEAVEVSVEASTTATTAEVAAEVAAVAVVVLI